MMYKIQKTVYGILIQDADILISNSRSIESIQ